MQRAEATHYPIHASPDRVDWLTNTLQRLLGLDQSCSAPLCSYCNISKLSFSRRLFAFQCWLIAIISDTGMRLSEAAGLLTDDTKLDAHVSHIALRKHPWRSLKTASSERYSAG